jgi:hypothetical protein
MHGKTGKNIKAHDIFCVPGCLDCHDYIDGRSSMGRITSTYLRQEIFNRAHAKWLVYLLESGVIEVKVK